MDGFIQMSHQNSLSQSCRAAAPDWEIMNLKHVPGKQKGDGSEEVTN